MRSVARLERRGVAPRDGGDTVTAGEQLGQVGNSGNTSEPHLHIHAELGPYQGERSDNPGIAMTFEGQFLVRNSTLLN